MNRPCLRCQLLVRFCVSKVYEFVLFPPDQHVALYFIQVFGDIHGQFPDLLEFFTTYGCPNHRTGDIRYVNYVFVGDFVDRGKFSLEVIVLLFSLKLRHPDRVCLVRGNHEDRLINEVPIYVDSIVFSSNPDISMSVCDGLSRTDSWMSAENDLESTMASGYGRPTTMFSTGFRWHAC